MPSYLHVDGGHLFTGPGFDPAVVGAHNLVRAENVTYKDGVDSLALGWESYGSPIFGRAQLIHHAENAAGAFEQLVFLPTLIRRRNTPGTGWSTVGSGSNHEGVRWQAATLHSETVACNGYDPVVIKPVGSGSFQPIRQLREIGVITCGALWAWGGFLILGDIEELRPERKAEWFNTANDPYRERPPWNWMTRTPSMVLWTDNPTKWRRILTGKLRGNTILLEHVAQSFRKGDQVSFVQSASNIPASEKDLTAVVIDETWVTNTTKNSLTVGKGGNADGLVFDSDYFRQLVGFDELTFSGKVLGIRSLSEQLVILMDRGFVIGQRTGDPSQPFAFDPVGMTDIGDKSGYLFHRNTLCSIGDEWLFYRGRSAWYRFNLGTRRPSRIPELDAVESLFSHLTAAHTFHVHAMDHSQENQIWISFPDPEGKLVTVIYDYHTGKVRTLDYGWTAFGATKHPEFGHQSNVKDWLWLMGEDSLQAVSNWGYRYTNGTPLYERRGKPYTGTLRYGFEGSNQLNNHLTRYEVLVAGNSENTPLRVKLWRRGTGNAEGKLVFDQTIEDPTRKASIRVRAKDAYFQDEITFTGPTRISGRVFDTTKKASRLRGYS